MNEQSQLSSPKSSIDVSAIERELTSLWKQAGEDEDDGGIIRASLLNLIIYTPSTDDLTKLDDILTDVTAAHPCRAILTIADREAEDSFLSAEVTSRCTLPTAASKQVCCEQVTITARKSQVDTVASLIVQLLLSDLPVYLWWRAVPRLDDKAFHRLVDISNRVVIDSADFHDPYRDLASLAVILRDNPRWAAFSDMNWARLNAWRALLAGFYDVSEYRPLLNELNRVVIEYSPLADSDAIPTRALLLGGWLASRLGWSAAGGAKTTPESTLFELTSGDKRLTMEFTRTSRDIEPGHLALVTLGTTADQAASFSVRRSADGNRIETGASLGEAKRFQRVLSYENWSESALIGKELELMGHDRVYEQAVVKASELIAQSGAS
jgi:glucose-6-phosphate dehydrogenase assembly protein OpcA